MAMQPITALIPRPHTTTIAGRTVLVSELRLIDLADLQDWLDGRWANPATGLRAKLAELEDDRPARQKLLGEAYDVAERGPPVWGDPASAESYGTAEGVVVFLVVVLRRHHPDITAELACQIAVEMQPGEFEDLRRIAYRLDPVDEIEGLMGFGESASRGHSVCWSEAIDEVAQSHGWTYEQIYGLTITEFINARRGGKPKEHGRIVEFGEDLRKIVREQRRRFYGDDGASA